MDDAEEKRRIRQRTRDQLDRLKQNRKGKEKLVLNLTSSGDGGGNVAVGVSSSTVSSKFKISIKSET